MSVALSGLLGQLPDALLLPFVGLVCPHQPNLELEAKAFVVIVPFRTTRLRVANCIGYASQIKKKYTVKYNHSKGNNAQVHLVLIAIVVHAHVFCLGDTRGHFLRNSAPEIRSKYQTFRDNSDNL